MQAEALCFGEAVNLLFVGIGGGAGSILRYISVQLAAKMFGDTLPVGTLLVNIIGCFLIGALMPALAGEANERSRLLLVVGFLGGFTTFSAFGWEAVALGERPGFALAYIAASNALGIGAVLLGVRLTPL